jgi:2-amino-4-hydroxy-6-hydroxymethyldihydropteridine diphosphokinase
MNPPVHPPVVVATAAPLAAAPAPGAVSSSPSRSPEPGHWLTACVGLGANLGDAPAALRAAVRALQALPGTEVQQVSALYRSAPVDAGGPDYFNAVAALRTVLAPHDLLQALQQIELAAGRERPYRNAPRTLDLDILCMGDLRLDTATLTLPHPRWAERAFVLLPLADVAPECVQAQQIAAVADQRIERVAPPSWARGAF